MTLEDAVRLAIEVLDHDQDDDEVASRKLSEAAGISIGSASTLITFVPLAFGRVRAFRLSLALSADLRPMR